MFLITWNIFVVMTHILVSTWPKNKQVHKKLLGNRRFEFKDRNFCFAWFKAVLAGFQGAMVASCLHKAEQTTPFCHTHLKAYYQVGYLPGETSKAGRDLSSGKVIFSIVKRTVKNCPSPSCFVFSLNQDSTLKVPDLLPELVNTHISF